MPDQPKSIRPCPILHSINARLGELCPLFENGKQSQLNQSEGAEAAMAGLRFKLAAALARPSNLALMTNKDVGLKCGQRVSLYPPAIRPRKVAPDRFYSFS
jgi:hypothetical protein